MLRFTVYMFITYGARLLYLYFCTNLKASVIGSSSALVRLLNIPNT